VDPAALYDKMFDPTNKTATDLVLLLPKDLDILISNLVSNIVTMHVINQPTLRKPITAEEFDLERQLVGAFGAVLWQKAEAMWLGRSATHRAPVRLFFSYATKDRKRVLPFKAGLKSAGYDVWIDEKDIIVGEPLLDSISNAISGDADFALMFLSENSINSEWVKLEIRMAYSREIKSRQTFLLPVRLTDCAIPDHLRVKKYANAAGRTSKCIAEIIDALRNLIGKRPYF
jgi:hypothetical protein